MKTWNVSEVHNLAQVLRPLVGTRLQEVITRDNDVVLGFYSANYEGLYWLWIDLNPLVPSVLPWTQLPFRPAVQKSPLQLFLKAHFVNHALVDVVPVEAMGKVIKLIFAAHQIAPPHELELQLVPHTRNLIARSQDKKLNWQKPTDLSESGYVAAAHESVRDLETLREQWLNFRKFKSQLPKAGRAMDFKSELERKKKALKKVEEELMRKQDLPWKEIGEWLKAHQALEVPKEWAPFIDARRKLAWNIDQCFQRAKETEGKIFGTEQRRQTLAKEIEALEQKGEQNFKAPVQTPQPLKQAGAQGRTLQLAEGLTVISGKNAQDNLKLLRKARAWDLWFHMRDYPGKHAILFRNKNQKISDVDMERAALWFVRQHLGAKFNEHRGERFSIIVAECRHVHPIKGDKVGRVTFRDERTLMCKIP